MKMFEFAIPYSETVYGEVVYRVEAETTLTRLSS
jgi:hypothetical protein